jgi:formylglycine-generating enzyme required for sulfatase activity
MSPYWGRSQFKTAPVGTKKPTRLGIYDLSGNAREWCWDFWKKNYLVAAENNNPAGPPSVVWDAVTESLNVGKEYAFAHVVAGGDFIGLDDISLQNAFWPFPATSRQIVGIRIVRNVKQ